MVQNPDVEDGTDEDSEANSVKKVILLADVHGIPENYNNVMVLWKDIGLHGLKLICSCDHKMANIICGIQVHRCMSRA